MKADGIVLIDTKIVNDGIEKGFNAIKNEMNTVGLTAEKLGDKISLAFSGKVSIPIENAISKVKELESKLASATKEAEEAKLYGNDRDAERWANKQASYYDMLKKARKQLTQTIVKEANKEAKAEGKAAQKAAKERQQALKESTKEIRHFKKRLASIAASALIFNVISKGLRNVTDSFGSALMSNQKFADSWNDLKESASDAVYPISEALVPILKTAVEVATGLVTAIGKAFSAITGKTAEEIKEANKVAEKAKKSLAGFDEINVLQSNESKSGSSNVTGNVSPEDGTILSEMEESSKNISSYWTTIEEKSKAFYYDVLGKVDPGKIQDLANSTVNLKSGWEALMSTISIGDTDITGFIAEQAGNLATQAGGIAKMIGGLFDYIAAYRREVAKGNKFPLKDLLKEENGLWDAIGEITAGWGMAMSQYAGVYPGWSQEEWENMFLPSADEDYVNIFADTSTEAAEALDAYLDVFSNFETALDHLDWGNKIITEEDYKNVESLSNDLFDNITKANDEATKRAKESLKSLIGTTYTVIENGVSVEKIFDEKDYQAGVKALEDAQSKQEKLVSDNNAEILAILKNAWEKGRSLTDDETANIESLLDLSNQSSVNIIKSGARESVATAKDALTAKTTISAQELSEITQYANDERDTKIEAANEAYEETVAAANTAYYELGLISEEQYTALKTAAEETRDAEIVAAEKARDEVVEQARGMAGDSAAAVDPETGEMLSNWEILWNKMLLKVQEKVKEIKAAIKNAINKIIGWINAPSKAMNDWFSKYNDKLSGLLGYEIKFPQIPKLARGAVIPPGREFLAVLGDQKRGTNVEAPLDTIKQAVAEVLSVQDVRNNETVVTVNFSGDLAQLARILKPAIETETKRKGSSLITGGTY